MNPTATPTPLSDYDLEDYDGGYYEPAPRAFCDLYQVHETHYYVAINGRTYNCIGCTPEDMLYIESYDPGECEHGLSADLCSGPMHY